MTLYIQLDKIVRLLRNAKYDNFQNFEIKYNKIWKLYRFDWERVLPLGFVWLFRSKKCHKGQDHATSSPKNPAFTVRRFWE